VDWGGSLLHAAGLVPPKLLQLDGIAFNMSTAVPATAYMYSGCAAVHACVRLACVRGRVGGGVSQCTAYLYRYRLFLRCCGRCTLCDACHSMQRPAPHRALQTASQGTAQVPSQTQLLLHACQWRWRVSCLWCRYLPVGFDKSAIRPSSLGNQFTFRCLCRQLIQHYCCRSTETSRPVSTSLSDHPHQYAGMHHNSMQPRSRRNCATLFL
jgi:hypothetical protein